MKKALIAVCGMNCALCMAYLREKNECPGCRGDDTGKNKSCIRCRMKNCSFFKKTKATYCFECPMFPCDKVLHIDKRYRTRYGMSMIENLENIRKSGIRKFLKAEETKWACPQCGGSICVHNKKCYGCGATHLFRTHHP